MTFTCRVLGGFAIFALSRPFLSIMSSYSAASSCTWHVGSHRLIWALKSPARTLLPSRIALSQFNFRTGLSPECLFIWSETLTILIILSSMLLTAVAMTSSFAPLLQSVPSSTTKLLLLRIAVQTLFLFLILYAEWLIPIPSVSRGDSCKHSPSALGSTRVSNATIVHSYHLAQLCWITQIIGS
jgi:hypothetical protein